MCLVSFERAVEYTRMTYFGIYVLLSLCISYSTCQTYDDAAILRQTLLNSTNYDKLVRPVLNQSKAVQVNVSLQLLSLGGLEETTGRLQFSGVMKLLWYDQKLVWNPVNHSGVCVTPVRLSEIWLPDLAVINSFEEQTFLSKYDFRSAKVRNNGQVYWTPSDNFIVSCVLDVTYYPYDTHDCSISVAMLDYRNTEVYIQHTRPDMDMSHFRKNGEWDIIGSSTLMHVEHRVNVLEFSITLRRRAAFMILNIIIPIIAIFILNNMVFLLPSEAEERVSLSVTLLLAIAVFFTLIGSYVPTTSEPMAILIYYLTVIFILSCYICVVVILNLRLYHRDDSKPVPRWCGSFATFINCKANSRTERSNVKNTDIVGAEIVYPNAFADEEHPEIQNRTDKSEDIRGNRTTWKDVSCAVDTCHFLLVWLIQLVVTTTVLVHIFATDRT